MALLQYFKPLSKDQLPNPQGPLSAVLPPAAITSANESVQKQSVDAKKRGPYHRFSNEKRAEIGKYASENGVAAACRLYSKELEKPLNESTVRGIKKTYLEELSRKRKAEENMQINCLPTKKRGAPLKLGEKMDKQVQAYLVRLREKGGVVNTAIAMASARGIVLKLNQTSLAEFGGHIDITKNWAKSLLHRMDFVKRKRTTKSKVTVENFERIKADFQREIATTVAMEDIPAELVFNWDQTGLNLVPASNWTMEVRGSKRVEVAGLTDKRQITAVLCGTLTGDFLPPQLIYKGKTKRCHPVFSFPSDWLISHSPNHWSNESTMIEYVNARRVREDLNLSQDHPALAIYDSFKGQLTDEINELLETNSILDVTVPANCTDRLQPLDISLNKAVKDILRREFQVWYSEKLSIQLDDELEGDPIDVSLTSAAMKTEGAKWLVRMFEYVQQNPSLVVNGFTHAGIPQALDDVSK